MMMYKKMLVFGLALAISTIATQVTSAALIVSIERRNSFNTYPQIAAPLDEGALIFVDRTTIYRMIPPSLVGADYVMVANDDKAEPFYELDVTLSQPTILYLLLDNRMGHGSMFDESGYLLDPDLHAAGMNWVTDLGFTDTGFDIGVDIGGGGTIEHWSSIYALPVGAGTVTLFQQYDVTHQHSRNMYGVAAFGATAARGTIYVDADAGGANNGSSWTDAYRYLQNGLAAAWSGDEIRVAQGIYKPDEGVGITPGDRTATFRLKNGVAIKGGYAGFGEPDPNARDVEAYETILSGDLLGNDGPDFANNGENSYHVVTGSGANATAVLDGFTITAGNASYIVPPHNNGGGMNNDYGSPMVANCTFSGNSAFDLSGGMSNVGSSPTVTNCTFSENTAGRGSGMSNQINSNPTLINCTFSGNSAGWGGGMYNDNSSPMLTGCTFSDNSTPWDGGGMANWNFSSPTLNNCNFSNNSVEYYSGGGMFNCENSSPTLTNCTFSNNSAGAGGGMGNQGNSSPTITNCTFIGNSAGDVGGGMVNREYSSPTLNDCTFTGNSADSGGGGMNNEDFSNPTLTNCTFSGNSAEWGGGMVNYYNSSPTVGNCTFSGNSAEQKGGGMYNSGNSPELFDCTFSGNSAGNEGGGMANYDQSNLTVTNCTFSGNSSDVVGGGMANFESSPTLTNCTFSSNSSGEVGGGMVNYESSPTLTNCTFIGNSAEGGGGMWNEPGNPTLTNCIFWGNTPEQIIGGAIVTYSDVQGGWPGEGNIDADPCFVGPKIGEPPEDAIAHWRFDEGQGDTAYDSAGENDGTLINNPTWTTGQIGGALSFDGEDSVKIPGFGNIAPTSEITIGMWVKLGAIRNQDLFSLDPFEPRFQDRITVHFPWGNEIIWQFGEPDLGLVITLPSGITGIWEHYAFVASSSGNFMKIYRNGVEAASKTGMNNFVRASADGHIGGSRPGAKFIGAIDDVRIYDRALSAEEIQEFYQADYHLLPDSPCIDVGDNSAVPPSVVTDLDGKPRIINGTVDMGAYEFHCPGILYVDVDAAGANDGSSWANAYNYLQDALAFAWNGDEIRVGQDIYKPDEGGGNTPSDREATFRLKNGITIKGGYAGFGEPDPNARDIELYRTILSGDLLGNDGPGFVNNGENSYHVVTGSGTNEMAVLDGFTITGGNAEGGSDITTVGMISHWKFDEGQGSIAYDSAGNNDGTIYGAQWTTGQMDGALSFDGFNDYVLIPNESNFDATDQITVAAWIKVNMFDERWQAIVTKGDNAWRLHRYQDTSSVAFHCGDQWGYLMQANGSVNVNDGQWHHLTGVYDGSKIYLYVDGAMDASVNASGSINTNNYLVYIGENAERPGREWNGLIDDVRIYERALSAGEIQRLYSMDEDMDEGRKYGGGMYNDNGNPMLTNCVFSGNRAEEWGGGMFNQDGSSPTVTNCTFSGNSASESGGGIYNYKSSPTLVNCTFSGNSADYGGGIGNVEDSSPTLTNCILWDNTAPQMYNDETSSATVSYSDVQGGWPGKGNINANPLFGTPGLLELIDEMGMVSYWKLDGSADDSAGDNDGTVYGNPVWTNSQLGGALGFDGTGDYVDCGNDSSLNLTNNFSISAWFNLNGAGTMLLICKGNVPAYLSGGAYTIFSNYIKGGLYFYVRKSNDAGSGSAITSVSLNEWIHVVGTFSDGNISIYKNGVFVQSTGLGTSTIYSNNGPLGIGAEGDGGRPFKGIIDEVAIHNRALSDEEIQQLYQIGLTGYNDYPLLPDSPCIDAGDPNYAAEPNETDLDGKPRVIGGRIDMGAYEFNHIPVADAGPEREVGAWPDGIAEVTLDGSGSYDDDGQPLSYLWSWTVGGNTYTATGPTPTIELPVGEQTIELIVNDGIDDSEADEVVITVIEPIEVAMKFTPEALNPDSKGNWVKAHFVLPAAFTIEDVDAHTPATVAPLDIESEYINVFVNEDGLVEIEAAFGRAVFCGAATGYGPVEVTVVGLLTSGQYFYGTDTIKIINKSFEYLGVLASHWLEGGCGAPDWCGGVDLDHNSLVDLVDFAMFDGCCIEVIRQ